MHLVAVVTAHLVIQSRYSRYNRRNSCCWDVTNLLFCMANPNAIFYFILFYGLEIPSAPCPQYGPPTFSLCFSACTQIEDLWYHFVTIEFLIADKLVSAFNVIAGNLLTTMTAVHLPEAIWSFRGSIDNTFVCDHCARLPLADWGKLAVRAYCLSVD